jgi:rod shape-determining protein MreC
LYFRDEMLKRRHYIGLALVVVLTLVVLNLPVETASRLKLGIGSLFLPLFGLAGSSQQLAGKAADSLVPRRELLRQNEQLRLENDQLRIQSMRLEAAEHENARLRELVGWQQQQPWKLRLARVILREPANWWRNVQIDLGSRDGLQPNMPVLTPQGLVGRISTVGLGRSQVALLGDPACKVSVYVDSPSRDNGIIGPGGPLDRDLVELGYLPRAANVKPGQLVRTSGQGGIYPKGIPVGTILDAQPVEYGLYTVARVRLAIDLSALETVWVLGITNEPWAQDITKGARTFLSADPRTKQPK